MHLKGTACHIINSQKQNLVPGQLLFIRDFDVHDHKSATGNYFEHVNLAFTKETFQEMCSYLGPGFPAQKLLDSSFPPGIILSDSEREKLFYAMTELTDSTDKNSVKIKLKALLIDIFVRYFFDYSENKTDVPLWLEMTCEKMKKKKNFIEGTKRMYEICPKTREHLCRSLKKYYNTTPCTFINNLRLEYSTNLLLASNLSITDVCYECGFENISWFYKAFSKKYGVTPSQYRKNHNIN